VRCKGSDTALLSFAIVGIAEPKTFDAGIRDLYRTAEADGVFCYTFFKAVAQKRQRA